MQVCRMRKTPVIVFINKLDRDGKNRFDLLEEIEKELSISLHPMTWPINRVKTLKVCMIFMIKVLGLFTANTKATDEDAISINDLSSTDTWMKNSEKEMLQHYGKMWNLIDGVYGELDEKHYLSGDVAPVFFGSAINNFGVKEMLDTFIRIAPVPRDRETNKRSVGVDEDKFSGFVFKIHANLDP